ncbi:hypothetical protein [Streptomyces sp. NPDC053367]|uniref:hypothetical protein n=1 Tax=Streptomyces sp. NPDC053367 TaxID=3365700 RepID=UPI0037D5078D
MSSPLPPATSLTGPQYNGWACVWCGTSLARTGGVSAGIARGQIGAHVLDVEVYACPAGCRTRPTKTPARAGDPPQNPAGRAIPNHTQQRRPS